MKRFALILGPATLGGALWEMADFPLGWLMGAAVVTGGFAAFDIAVSVPGPLYKISLATLGASVGLAVTPQVATVLVSWLPLMVTVAILGMAAAGLVAPALAKFGGMSRSTAFFSLLPGGVIEMANIGDRFGADRMVVSILHATRVGLVVGLLPLGLFLVAGLERSDPGAVSVSSWTWMLAVVLLTGALGGWIGARLNMPAAWLLGAVVSVGLVSSFDGVSGQIPSELLAIVQVLVGIQLGARFQRARLSAVPRALAAGLPAVLVIMGVMAGLAAVASLLVPFSLSTLVLSFAIGGMAEMVLTSKALGENVAVVAAFQAVRGVVVNASAGALWRRISSSTDSPKLPKE